MRTKDAEIVELKEMLRAEQERRAEAERKHAALKAETVVLRQVIANGLLAKNRM